MDTQTADRILLKTQADYEVIAHAFTESRTDLWEEREYFGAYVADGLSVLDLGCANGRLLKLFEKHKVAYTGVDSNATLLKSAEDYAKSFPQITATFVNTDMRKLPFDDATFDRVFCIAALHHIPSSAYQLQALHEMFRVLKPGGMQLMTNWDLASQARYVKKNEQVRTQYPDLCEGCDVNDFFVSWTWGLSRKTIRYYHSFTQQELTSLFERTGFTNTSQNISNGSVNIQKKIKRNIITIAQKPT